MTKYPNAFSTPVTKSHIQAAQDNLNSAKNAKREIQTQKQSERITPTLPHRSKRYQKANREYLKRNRQYQVD